MCVLGAQRPRPYLTSVYADEQYMVDVVNKCIRHFHVNRPGPVSFLDIYQEYYYILDGTAYQDLQKFFALEPPPTLKVRYS